MPFCSSCLLELPQDEQVCPVDRTLLLQRSCPKCIHCLARLDKFCGLCGETLNSDTTNLQAPVNLPPASKLRILAGLAADLHVFTIGYGVCAPAFMEVNSVVSAIGFGLLGPIYWVGLSSGGRQTVGQYLASCVAVNSRKNIGSTQVHPTPFQVMGGVANRFTFRKLAMLRQYDWAFEVLRD